MSTTIKTHAPDAALMSKPCDRLGRDVRASGTTPTLSFRERQITELVQQAKTNKEIAHELCLSVGTVKEYIYHIFRKLGVKNRTELALWDRNNGQTMATS